MEKHTVNRLVNIVAILFCINFVSAVTVIVSLFNFEVLGYYWAVTGSLAVVLIIIAYIGDRKRRKKKANE